MSLKKGKLLNQYDYSGGVNIADPGYLIADNECYARTEDYDKTANVYWDKGLYRRLGTATINTTAEVTDKIVNGIRFYRSAAPTKTTIVAGDDLAGTETKILYVDGTALTEIGEGGTGSKIANGQVLYFAPWKDKLYVASGEQVIQVISYSGAWARTDVTGLTSEPAFICHHKDRLWAAGGDMPVGYMECTGYGSDSSWSGGDGEAFNVGYKDGDPIMQLMPLRDDLAIYKNDSIWFMQGDNLYNWFQRKRNKTIGCVASKSVADVGFGHIFLSADNVYFFDGNADPVPIGNKIKPWLDNIPTSMRPLAAGCYFNNFYRLAFASSAETVHNDVELVLDLKVFKQGKIAWWLNNSRNIAAYIPATGPVDVDKLYMCDGDAGYVRQMETGSQDISTNIKYEFHSKYVTFDWPNRYKAYGILKVDTTAGIGDVELTINRNLNDDWQVLQPLDCSGSSATFATANLGTSYWTSQANARITHEIALPAELDGYSLAYYFTHSGNYDNVGVFGLSIEYALRSF